jgi:hypothetical protein
MLITKASFSRSELRYPKIVHSGLKENIFFFLHAEG